MAKGGDDPAAFAWAAGFIDGEGCVCIYEQKKRDLSNYCLSLSAVTVVRAPLERLRALFGGYIHYYSKPSRHRIQPYYSWALHSGRKVQRALKAMWPYLSVKVAQAATAFVFPIGRQGARLHPLARILQDECCKRMHVLNRRGVTA